MKSELIRVVFISDEKYAMPTGVAIASLRHSRNTGRPHEVVVISNGMGGERRSKIESLSCEGFQVETREAPAFEKFEALKIDRLHVSPTALYKFELPLLFPGVDKILYLDSDVLIQRDLGEIFDRDLGGRYAAVVKDFKALSYRPSILEKLHLAHECYFNSGVMLLNLRQMRADDLFPKLLDYRTNGINFFMDQDALNVVFRENVEYLPFPCNLIGAHVDHFGIGALCRYHGIPVVARKSDFYKNATILHMANPYKPWIYEVPVLSDLFKESYGRSSYRNEPLTLAPLPAKGPGGAACVAVAGGGGRISVLMPAWGPEAGIRESRDSLAAQESGLAEIIEPGGGSPAEQLEAGLAAATGEYMFLPGPGDLYEPTFLCEVGEQGIRDRADIVLCDAWEFDAESRLVGDRPGVLAPELLAGAGSISPAEVRADLFRITRGQPWAMVFRKEFLARHAEAWRKLPPGLGPGFGSLALVLAERITIVNRKRVLHRMEAGGSLPGEGGRAGFLRDHAGLKTALESLGRFAEVEQGFFARVQEDMLDRLLSCPNEREFTALFHELRQDSLAAIEGRTPVEFLLDCLRKSRAAEATARARRRPGTARKTGKRRSSAPEERQGRKSQHEERIQKLQQRLDAVQSTYEHSLSWRITAPLRGLVRWMGGGGPGRSGKG